MQTILAYNENGIREEKNYQNIKPEDKIWIDLVDPSVQVINNLVSHFNLDQDAVDLYLNKSKKPQIRLLDDHKFTILLDIEYKDSQAVVTEGLYLFCGKSWLITIHPSSVALREKTRKLLEHKNKRLLEDSIDSLFYNILSQMIAKYEQVLTDVELTITGLEEKSLSDPEKETLTELDRLSRQLIVIRRHFWRIRDVVNFLTHIEEDKNEVKYIQMAYDNIAQLIELVESYGDTINSVRDLYIANISLQMNDTMKTLTIFASILLPLTLVAGIYGMNGLDLNKLSQLPSGFLVVLVPMIVITVALLYLFTRKRWISLSGKKVLPKNPPKNK
jgi:magnesium transporter